MNFKGEVHLPLVVCFSLANKCKWKIKQNESSPDTEFSFSSHPSLLQKTHNAIETR